MIGLPHCYTTQKAWLWQVFAYLVSAFRFFAQPWKLITGMRYASQDARSIWNVLDRGRMRQANRLINDAMTHKKETTVAVYH